MRWWKWWSDGQGLGHFSPQSIDAIVLNNYATCVKLAKEGEDVPFSNTNIPKFAGNLGSSFSLLPNFRYHQNEGCICIEPTIYDKCTYLSFYPQRCKFDRRWFGSLGNLLKFISILKCCEEKLGPSTNDLSSYRTFQSLCLCSQISSDLPV